MTHVALYSRVSTSYQSSGLEAQERALINFCEINKITNYKLYSDQNISGATSSRPELNKMMKDAENNSITKVVVYSFSRFARSTKHLLEALEFFKRRKVKFVSLSENIDTDSAIGTAFFTIISAIAQLERELISERVKNGLANAKAKGKKIGRPKTRPSKAIINLYNDGHSYRQISKLVGFSHTAVAREIKNYKRDQIHSSSTLITNPLE